MTRRLLSQKKIEDPKRKSKMTIMLTGPSHGRGGANGAASRARWLRVPRRFASPAYVAHARKIHLKLNAAMARQGNYRVLWPGGSGRGNLNGSNLPCRRDVCNCAFCGEMGVMGTAIARLKV
jgi:hypothetical protein